MKSIFSTLLIALVLLGFSAHAQDSGDEYMEKYMELMKPGPMHEKLHALAGEWELTGKIWMMPGQPPTDFSGVAQHRMILDDRFLMMESQSGEGDMYTESMIIMGYDNRNEEFSYVGYDTWGTYYVTAKGQFDEEARAWVLNGQDVDPVLGMEQTYFFRISWVDDDTMKSEVIFLDYPGVEEKEFKMLEMVYHRK